MNECSQLQTISNQLKASHAFGSSIDGECCSGPIVCDLNRKVIEINLSNHDLKGFLPPSVFGFSNLVEINLSDNPGLFGSLPKLASSLSYLDVSNTNISGVVNISSLSSLSTCKFGPMSKLCVETHPLAPTVCVGFNDLGLCSDLKSSVASTPTSTTSIVESMTTRMSKKARIVSQSSKSTSVFYDEIQLDHSDISSTIIIMWSIAAVVMVISLMICLCLLFAHKYGKSDKVRVERRKKSQRFGGGALLGSIKDQGQFSNRFESLPGNRSIYELRAEKIADKIILKNGERYFPVRNEFNGVKSDEMSLSRGDTVTVYRAFEDGWAEGISLRNGKGAYFPLKCLGGVVPLVLQDPELFHSDLESVLESVNSPLPPLLQTTPVFLSPSSAKHTCLPVLGATKSSPEQFQMYENLIDLDFIDGKEDQTSESFVGENRDFDSSYNPFRGSILNMRGSTKISIPEMIHSAEASTSLINNDR